MNKTFPYQLYLVISQKDCIGKNMLDVAEKAILGGVDIIQLREKELQTTEFIDVANRLKDLTDKYNIPLIINDNIEVAIQVNASGIHVGNTDIPPTQIRKLWNKSNKIIGYSIEYLEQLENEESNCTDYLGISPVFNTATKTDTITEWGLEGIAKIRAKTDKPLVAIGNMNMQNVHSVMNAGADCIAVVSAICSAKDPEKAAYELKNEICK